MADPRLHANDTTREAREVIRDLPMIRPTSSRGHSIATPIVLALGPAIVLPISHGDAEVRLRDGTKLPLSRNHRRAIL